MGSKTAIRSDDPEYMNATAEYVSTLGRIIERVEITNLIYSSAEIFTWARGAGSTRVLILNGGAGETHEFGLPNLQVYLLWRNDAYNYWSLVVIKAGYLIRTAHLINNSLRLTGDVNATREIEVICSPAASLKGIAFNGEVLQTSKTSNGNLQGIVRYNPPKLDISDLSNLEWKFIDSLPETQASYDDSAWTPCIQCSKYTPRQPDTPSSLYSMDYGFHTGYLLYHGYFNANGREYNVWLNVSGGAGFGHSVRLNDTLLGSWVGSRCLYIISVLIGHMGQYEEAPGTDAVKFPRGILNYGISGHAQSDVSWKLMGNLAGEKYQNGARGPLNDGGMYAKRQGYHYPSPPTSTLELSNPVTYGLSHVGVGFYAAYFRLNIPCGWDFPMSVVFNDSLHSSTKENSLGNNYRCQLLVFINGYQFRKYKSTNSNFSNLFNNFGPQAAFPVPEGILNHGEDNHIGLTVWAQDKQGATQGSL
ncbi:unnamed protein product [Penicillium nalgiovense]|uniref:Beta-galactosidase n=1 Tax=Penicillium nalgiovense TaxID=60175 RepID=A0A9W4HDR7_PENNA|nr:unnamed protein product [Penicillium nalgiovense]CAG7950276.1 unnamed protein product [Penicillium nalgiovense]CAG7978798.1 unnamed protein product [Penicillium nalgiovense]CAG8003569.1 unnamed protein product [Penicillium nalgiovense]CAG8012958.1 unnamed protein product [Penicillium nalgiovense]